ncbi:MAG: cell division protein FtsZ [Dehalococcoidales bacterium]|nr:cell division protein FtsZ [Dehalococcoidales bacterium]
MTRTFEDDLKQELQDPESAKMFGAAHAKSSFALTLATARARLGLTQKELAARIGVSQSYIAKLEGGEANPTLDRIGSLLAVLGLSLTTGTATLSPYPDIFPDTLPHSASMLIPQAKILVIGVGGAGCNAINRMVREQIRGVQFVAMNTEASGLDQCEASVRLLLGERLTLGKGVSGDHKLGQKAAEESRYEIKAIVDGADVVFITAGMGGGTGTGAAPIIADIAKQNGALTVAVVTKPFAFEGTHRTQVAEEGIIDLSSKVDTLIIIPNDRLLDLIDPKTTMEDTFKLVDDVLRQGVQAISETITVPGLITLDPADLQAIMKDAGPAWMSVGTGTGRNRAADAARTALASPLLDVSIEGAKRVLFNICGGSGLSLFEVNDAAEVIRQAVDPEANVIFSVVLDPRLKDEVRVTLIATGLILKRGFAKADDIEAELRELLKGLKGKVSSTSHPSPSPSSVTHKA